MKYKIVSTLTAVLITTSALSMTAFAYGGYYDVYDPTENAVLTINIYDYPGETIESFCAKHGFQLIGTNEETDAAAFDEFMESTGASYGYDENSGNNSSPASSSDTASISTVEESASSTTAPNTQLSAVTASTSSVPVATKEENTKSSEKTAKANASHGPYDGITDEAKEAFIGFTSDGVVNSCYIDVNEDADNLVMPKETIAYTKANREDGSVNLVDTNGELVVGFTFPQVEATEDVNLNCDITVNDGVYDITFKKETNPECNVLIKIPLSERNTEYHIYDSEGEQFFDVTTDDDGNAEFAVMTLSKYQITTGDYVEEAETIEDTEIEDNSETAEEPVTEELTEETTETEESETATTMPEVAETPASTSTSIMTYVPAIIVAVIAATVAAWILVFKKK